MSKRLFTQMLILHLQAAPIPTHMWTVHYTARLLFLPRRGFQAETPLTCLPCSVSILHLVPSQVDVEFTKKSSLDWSLAVHLPNVVVTLKKVVENFQKGRGASFFWITEGKAAASTEVSLTPTEIQTSLCFHFPALSKLWLTNWAVTGDRLFCGFCQVPDFHLLLKTSRNSV